MTSNRPPRVPALSAALALALTGCAGGVKRENQITISSNPGGAVVYADGTELGRTPLTINPGDYFSSGFAHDAEGLVYRYKGVLAVKKPGCEPYTKPVNDAVLSKDVHVKLDCKPGVSDAPVAAVPAAKAPAPAARPAPERPRSIEQRLRRAKQLHEEGLISTEEYRRVKARILKEL